MITHVIVGVIAAVIQLAIMYMFKFGARTSVKQIDEYSIEQSKNPIKEGIQAFLPAMIASMVTPMVAGKLLGSEE